MKKLLLVIPLLALIGCGPDYRDTIACYSNDGNKFFERTGVEVLVMDNGSYSVLSKGGSITRVSGHCVVEEHGVVEVSK